MVLGVSWSALIMARPMFPINCELGSKTSESYHLECFTRSTLIVKIFNSYFQPQEQSHRI